MHVVKINAGRSWNKVASCASEKFKGLLTEFLFHTFSPSGPFSPGSPVSPVSPCEQKHVIIVKYVLSHDILYSKIPAIIVKNFYVP